QLVSVVRPQPSAPPSTSAGSRTGLPPDTRAPGRRGTGETPAKTVSRADPVPCPTASTAQKRNRNCRGGGSLKNGDGKILPSMPRCLVAFLRLHCPYHPESPS